MAIIVADAIPPTPVVPVSNFAYIRIISTFFLDIFRSLALRVNGFCLFLLLYVLRMDIVRFGPFYTIRVNGKRRRKQH